MFVQEGRDKVTDAESGMTIVARVHTKELEWTWLEVTYQEVSITFPLLFDDSKEPKQHRIEFMGLARLIQSGEINTDVANRIVSLLYDGLYTMMPWLRNRNEHQLTVKEQSFSLTKANTPSQTWTPPRPPV